MHLIRVRTACQVPVIGSCAWRHAAGHAFQDSSHCLGCDLGEQLKGPLQGRSNSRPEGRNIAVTLILQADEGNSSQGPGIIRRTASTWLERNSIPSITVTRSQNNLPTQFLKPNKFQIYYKKLAKQTTYLECCFTCMTLCKILVRSFLLNSSNWSVSYIYLFRRCAPGTCGRARSRGCRRRCCRARRLSSSMPRQPPPRAPPDLYNRLYRERVLFLCQALDDELANHIKINRDIPINFIYYLAHNGHAQE